MRKILLATALMGVTALAMAGDGAGWTPSFTIYAASPGSNNTTLVKDGYGLGLRFGHHFNRTLEWDIGLLGTRHKLRNAKMWDCGGCYFVPADGDYQYIAATTALNFHFHPWEKEQSSLYFGLGVGYNNISADSCFFGVSPDPTLSYPTGPTIVQSTSKSCGTADDSNSGFVMEVAAGINVSLSERVNLKIDLRQQNYNEPSRTDGDRSHYTYHRVLGLGLGFPFGYGPAKDSDGDGVNDGKDKCPDTPSGASVDAKGCPTDEDGDGVYDGLDRCPGTPKGAKVDASGCELDDDMDGVVNSKDKCPNTPRGATVDASGCPMDSDKDGVYDGIDRCPGTPAGTRVDATGCPMDSDDDGDGIMNSKDKCPGTKRGTSVDPSGCAKMIEGTTLVRLSGTDMTFASGKATIPSSAHAKLNEVAAKLIEVQKANPGMMMEVSGHTDNKGSAKFNTSLSRARANAVSHYLIKQGVPASSLIVKGYGPSKPVDSNDTTEGRALNRRVEVTVAQ